MSVFKRPGSPYYYAEFQIDNTRFCRSTRKTTEREARAEERILKAKEQARLSADKPKSDTLNLDQGFGKYWLEHGSKLAWASEVERYIKLILKHVDGSILIEDLTDAEVNDFVQAWNASGGGVYALNRALAIWRAMHRRARKKWRQRAQEIDWTDFLNDEEKRVRSETLETMRLLVDNLPAKTGLAVEWSLYTGIRKFETFGLLWDNVYLDQGKATVTAKGGRQHTIWLSEQAMDVLARCERKGRYVFDRRAARYAFEKACEKIGLQDFRWHDLRHTAATWLRQAGVPVEIVQRVLGHADIATTMRYAHVVDTEVQDAMRKLPKIGSADQKIVQLRRKK